MARWAAQLQSIQQLGARLGRMSSVRDIGTAIAVELQELIDTVAVPETWFFRDRGAFIALARIALDAMVRRGPTDVLRILSVPCSTGEEPYSIAMSLLDAGLSPQRFQVEAIDISHRAIERARAGVYRRNSFRGQDLLFRGRHLPEQMQCVGRCGRQHETFKSRKPVVAQLALCPVEVFGTD